VSKKNLWGKRKGKERVRRRKRKKRWGREKSIQAR
jgi:hypothetical protein